jgi:transcriptional regulator with XRE-family HTH domain
MSGSAIHMSSPKRQISLSAAQLRGIRLKAARLLQGLSQEELAKKLGVTRQTVSGWENGAEIEEERMDAVSKAYAASKGWLRYREGEPPAGLERERLTRPDEDALTERKRG